MVLPMVCMFAFTVWMYASIFLHTKRLAQWNQAPFGVLTTINRIHYSCISRESCEFLPKGHIEWLIDNHYAQFETTTSASHLCNDLDAKLVLTKKWYRFFDQLTVDFDYRNPISSDSV
ncbi:hypothetical protein [Thaumasiovibrio subtropicus]|uniref:hypothetical protein n=1 Tax=Thaumasiovibrio subtropicus TaxID=1891207 RepID=UPI00131E0AC8|nr:hypothetical protein [Thaumasiovibrio subtropicus]